MAPAFFFTAFVVLSGTGPDEFVECQPTYCVRHVTDEPKGMDLFHTPASLAWDVDLYLPAVTRDPHILRREYAFVFSQLQYLQAKHRQQLMTEADWGYYEVLTFFAPRFWRYRFDEQEMAADEYLQYIYWLHLLENQPISWAESENGKAHQFLVVIREVHGREVIAFVYPAYYPYHYQIIAYVDEEFRFRVLDSLWR